MKLSILFCFLPPALSWTRRERQFVRLRSRAIRDIKSGKEKKGVEYERSNLFFASFSGFSEKILADFYQQDLENHEAFSKLESKRESTEERMEELIQIIYHFGIKCSQYDRDNFSRKAFYYAIKSLFNTETIVRFADHAFC